MLVSIFGFDDGCVVVIVGMSVCTAGISHTIVFLGSSFSATFNATSKAIKRTRIHVHVHLHVDMICHIKLINVNIYRETEREREEKKNSAKTELGD